MLGEWAALRFWPLNTVVRLRHFLLGFPVRNDKPSFAMKASSNLIYVGLSDNMADEYERPKLLVVDVSRLFRRQGKQGSLRRPPLGILKSGKVVWPHVVERFKNLALSALCFRMSNLRRRSRLGLFLQGFSLAIAKDFNALFVPGGIKETIERSVLDWS